MALVLAADLLPVGALTLAVVAAVTAAVHQHRRRRRKAGAVARLLARDRRLRPTVTPCGLRAHELTGFAALPRGDRHHGVRYAVEGPLAVEVAGAAAGVRCAAFQWWYEEEVTTGRSTRHRQRTVPVVAAELPVPVPTPVVVAPESLLGRLGLTRADQQLESSAFNRAFRVAGSEPRLVLHLLDARLQGVLVERFQGRTLELRGRHLLLAGTPDHRDASLEGVVGELPAVRQDLQLLVRHVPASFWRAIGADPEPAPEPRPAPGPR